MQAYLQGAKWKKLLIDWNKYQQNTTSTGFQFYSPKHVEKAVLYFLIIMQDYVRSAIRSKQQITSNEEHFEGKSWK